MRRFENRRCIKSIRIRAMQLKKHIKYQIRETEIERREWARVRLMRLEKFIIIFTPIFFLEMATTAEATTTISPSIMRSQYKDDLPLCMAGDIKCGRKMCVCAISLTEIRRKFAPAYIANGTEKWLLLMLTVIFHSYALGPVFTFSTAYTSSYTSLSRLNTLCV